MLQNKLRRFSFFLIAGIYLFTGGCGTSSDAGTGTLEIRMHDAPTDHADQVNVYLERVEINRNGSKGGWMTISKPRQTYDLLDLTNGAYTVLGDTTLEAGTYNQIRLILSETGHELVIDGQSYNMIIPGGAQTGVKLDVNAEIERNITYTLLLDFDAQRSVVEAGHDNSAAPYLLQPVIQATNLAVTGNIAGTVSPTDAKPVVYAISGSDTLSSTAADTINGAFKLIGLKGGIYNISVEPRKDTFTSAEQPDVMVAEGVTNDIGTIELHQK